MILPWRGGCEHREAALGWVRARYARAGLPVVLGHHRTGEWNKARAVRDGLTRTRAGLLIIADADVWAGGLPAAIEEVRAGAAWAVPHRGVFRLTQNATRRLLAGGEPDHSDLTERAYLGVEGGGVTVIRRDVYEDCPLDPRFTGWGSEDESHGMALRTLYGPPWRGKAPLTHLFHPTPQRATRSFGSEAGRDLRKRYVRASGNPDAMRALLQEAACPSLIC